MLPLPGPGWLVIFGGMAIWATEFVWAQLVLRWTKRKVTEAAQKALDPKVRRRNIILTTHRPGDHRRGARGLCLEVRLRDAVERLRVIVVSGRKCPPTWGNVGGAPGRLAQWESASFTPKRSLVRTQYRPPRTTARRLQVSGPSRCWTARAAAGAHTGIMPDWSRRLNRYRFRSDWLLDAPPTVVYAVLERAEAYPRWWPQVREVDPARRPQRHRPLPLAAAVRPDRRGDRARAGPGGGGAGDRDAR